MQSKSERCYWSWCYCWCWGQQKYLVKLQNHLELFSTLDPTTMPTHHLHQVHKIPFSRQKVLDLIHDPVRFVNTSTQIKEMKQDDADPQKWTSEFAFQRLRSVIFSLFSLLSYFISLQRSTYYFSPSSCETSMGNTVEKSSDFSSSWPPYLLSLDLCLLHLH